MKVNNPPITVLMSVYNDEDYLSESISSILSQSFKKFEFIIINDGSTDKTNEILEAFRKKDRRIKLIKQENIGLTKSLNRGIKFANGDFIARQDADDVSSSQRLEKQYSLMEHNSDISVCFTWNYVINDTGKKIGEMVYSTKHSSIKNNLINKNKNIYCHGSAMIRKEVLEKEGGYDEDKYYEQDAELWRRLLKEGYKFNSVGDLLYYFRLRESSISKKGKTNNKKEQKNYYFKHLHNILFRAQKRREILKNTIRLYKMGQLSLNDLFKCIVVFLPYNYKGIFKYF